jgi:DNA-binding CsgD family transcriptional regulator
MKAWTADGKRTIEIASPGNIIRWQDWTPQEIQDLKEMVKFGISHRDMSIHLGHSEAAVISKMKEIHNEAA